MTMQFTKLSFDYSVLDRFNFLCDYELILTNAKFNIYDKQFGEMVFENEIRFDELLKMWVEKAQTYFKDDYLENIGTPEDTDIARQKLYLTELDFISKYDVLLKGDKQLI